MPTIDIDYVELERFLGLTLHGNMEKLDDILALVKGEVKLYNPEEGVVSVEMKDTNRPDLWSVEGLGRALQGYLNKAKGIKQYYTSEPIAEIQVDSRLKNIRPYICCSIVKDVHLNDTIIRGLMHLQDKLDKTYGRNRQKTSIGIYDYDLITPPLNYGVSKPNEISFVPLGFSEKMTLSEILEKHPKGLEYGYIVKKHDVYPMLLDADQKVLSFPPIINSNDLGRVTETARNLLVEVTGTLHQTVLDTLNLVTLALIDRGGKAYSTTVHYPQENKTVTTPNFQSKLKTLNVAYANKLLGLKLSGREIANLLLTAGFDIQRVSKDALDALVPCYRIDVMHQVDLIEDVAVAYGYNNIEPLWRDLPTTGAQRPERRLIDTARELMVGLGYQEILNYTLTNSEALFTKMNREKTVTVEIANPKVVTMTCLRNWLLPGLMEFLSVNQSVEFPQKIFEIGKVTLLDNTKETRTRDDEWLAAATSHANANFSEIKSALDAFLLNFGVDWQVEAISHPSFIEGRVGEVTVNGVSIGVLGEISLQVLENWKLENPTAAFEIDMQKILKIKQTNP